MWIKGVYRLHSAPSSRSDLTFQGRTGRYAADLFMIIGAYCFNMSQERLLHEIVPPLVVQLRLVETFEKTPSGSHVPGGPDWSIEVEPQLSVMPARTTGFVIVEFFNGA